MIEQFCEALTELIARPVHRISQLKHKQNTYHAKISPVKRQQQTTAMCFSHLYKKNTMCYSENNTSFCCIHVPNKLAGYTFHFAVLVDNVRMLYTSVVFIL